VGRVLVSRTGDVGSTVYLCNVPDVSLLALKDVHP